MKLKAWHVLTLLFFVVLSFLPLFLDPFYHEEKVNFWVWLIREIEEIESGEH